LGWAGEPARLALKLTAPPGAVGRLAALAAEAAPESAIVARPAVGIGQLCAWDRSEREAVTGLAERPRGAAREAGGGVGGPGAPAGVLEGLDVWGVPGRDLGPMRRIREQFDPERTLNPGRFLGRL